MRSQINNRAVCAARRPAIATPPPPLNKLVQNAAFSVHLLTFFFGGGFALKIVSQLSSLERHMKSVKVDLENMRTEIKSEIKAWRDEFSDVTRNTSTRLCTLEKSKNICIGKGIS